LDTRFINHNAYEISNEVVSYHLPFCTPTHEYEQLILIFVGTGMTLLVLLHKKLACVADGRKLVKQTNGFPDNNKMPIIYAICLIGR
jgi:hypothetical protein